MSFSKVIKKIRYRLIRLRLRPIRVFCLHQVSESFDSLRCFECDWLQTNRFKQSITELLKLYEFIPLSEAQQKLSCSIFRCKRYAVLTFDDGYRSNLPVLNWLNSLHIPYTLFLNGKYLDGQSCSTHLLENARQIEASITEDEISRGLYLRPDDLLRLRAPIGSHGFEHTDATLNDKPCFKASILRNFACFKQSKIASIPFHAYTWGRHNESTDEVLSELGLIPVLMDNEMNYNDPTIIHRELFPSS